MLTSIIELDGATLVNLEGNIVQNKVTFRPPVDIPPTYPENDKGTRHKTGQIISQITSAICVVISVEGPITFYIQGEPMFKFFRD